MKILNKKIIESHNKAIFESNNLVTIYHGDDYGLDSINDKYDLMNQESGNLQEGVGIYFAEDKDVTKAYGTEVISIQVDKSKLLPSRADASEFIEPEKIANMLKIFQAHDEEFWYFLSNYAMISEPEELEDNEYLYLEAAEKIVNNQVRHLQIELCERIDNEVFVKAWLENTGYYGTYNDDIGFYAIMYTESDVIKV